MRLKYSYYPSLMDTFYLLFNDFRIVTTTVEVILDGSYCYPSYSNFSKNDHITSLSLFAHDVKLKLMRNGDNFLLDGSDDFMNQKLGFELSLIKPLNPAVTYQLVTDPQEVNRIESLRDEMGKSSYSLYPITIFYFKITLPHGMYNLKNRLIDAIEYLDDKDIVYTSRYIHGTLGDDLSQIKNFMYYLEEI